MVLCFLIPLSQIPIKHIVIHGTYGKPSMVQDNGIVDKCITFFFRHQAFLHRYEKDIKTPQTLYTIRVTICLDGLIEI